MEEEKQFLDELAKLERAARDAELEQRVAEAERKAAEAERYAQETLEATEEYLNDARNSRWYYRVGPYYPYYPTPYRHHYKRKYHNPSYYRHGKKNTTKNTTAKNMSVPGNMAYQSAQGFVAEARMVPCISRHGAE
jgi:hypothetical protein